MTRGIYPPGLAAMKVKHAGEKYRPSNGAEGEYFFIAWCSKCARDTHFSEDGDEGVRCGIVGLTYILEVEDEQYPVEWQYGKDGQPCCTAFAPKGEAIQPPRCQHTVDMFDGGSKGGAE